MFFVGEPEKNVDGKNEKKKSGDDEKALGIARVRQMIIGGDERRLEDDHKLLKSVESKIWINSDGGEEEDFGADTLLYHAANTNRHKLLDQLVKHKYLDINQKVRSCGTSVLYRCLMYWSVADQIIRSVKILCSHPFIDLTCSGKLDVKRFLQTKKNSSHLRDIISLRKMDYCKYLKKYKLQHSFIYPTMKRLPFPTKNFDIIIVCVFSSFC